MVHIKCNVKEKINYYYKHYYLSVHTFKDICQLRPLVGIKSVAVNARFHCPCTRLDVVNS